MSSLAWGCGSSATVPVSPGHCPARQGGLRVLVPARAGGVLWWAPPVSSAKRLCLTGGPFIQFARIWVWCSWLVDGICWFGAPSAARAFSPPRLCWASPSRWWRRRWGSSSGPGIPRPVPPLLAFCCYTLTAVAGTGPVGPQGKGLGESCILTVGAEDELARLGTPSPHAPLLPGGPSRTIWKELL